jgi:sugar/nucleoside kinase (ribokinase family)
VPVKQIVDPIGAGDAFAAGVLSVLLERGAPPGTPLSDSDLRAALDRGAAGASLAVEGWGPASLLAADQAAARARLEASGAAREPA